MAGVTPTNKIEEFIIRNEDGTERYHYYLFAYEDKFFTICKNVEASVDQPIFQTQFVNPQNSDEKNLYTFVLTDGHFDVSVLNEKLFCKVIKDGETEPRLVEVPINNSNCKTVDLFLQLPNEPPAERILPITTEFQEHANNFPVFKEVEIEERDLTPKPIIPDGNLQYKQDELSYFYLQYKNGEEKQYLRIIQHEGKPYINIKSLSKDSDQAQTKTCEIFGANFVNLDGKELLQLELNFDGKKKSVNFPITKENNDVLLEDLNKLVSKNTIESSPIEVFDCPKIDNFQIDPSLNPENIVEDFERTEKLRRSIRTGQVFETNTINFGGETLKGLKQNIALNEALGFDKKMKQELTLFDSKSYSNTGTSSVLSDALLMVTTSDSPNPVAVFAKDQEAKGIKFRISKEYLDEFKTKNPKLSLPDGAEKDGYVSYDLANLKLTKNLTIDDVSIKGAGSDFAVLFSSLGCQIKDAEGNLGKQMNEKHPFNIGVSTDFVLDAFAEKNGCMLDKTDPAYSALLISRIQMERENAKKFYRRARKPKDKIRDAHKEKDMPVHLKIPNANSADINLYSIPLKVKGKDGKDEVEFLNIRKEDEKTFVYLHLSSENKKGIAIPRFYEVDVAGLEDKNPKDIVENPSLYLGLKDKGNNITSVNIDLDYDENAESLTMLKDIMKEPFEKTPSLEESSTAQKGEREIGNRKFDVFPRPNEPGARITSFKEIAELTMGKEPPKTDPLMQGSQLIADPPEVERPRDTQKFVSYIDDRFNRGNQQDPVIGDGNNNPNPEKEKSDGDELDPMPGDIEWKTEIGKDKKKPKNGLRNTLIGLFALSVLLSVVLPFMQIAALVFGSIGVINEVKPWIVNGINSYKPSKLSKLLKKSKDKIKEKIHDMNLNRKLKNNLKKAQKKEKSAKNKIEKLKNEQKAMAEYEVLLGKEKMEKPLTEEEVKELEDLKNKNPEQLSPEEQERLEFLDKKLTPEEVEKLNKFKTEAAAKHKVENMKEIFSAKHKVESLMKQDEELKNEENDEFQKLIDKEKKGEVLSLEEREKLEKLRKKFKKPKKSSSAEYNNDISKAEIEYEHLKQERIEKENIVKEKMQEKENKKKAKKQEKENLTKQKKEKEDSKKQKSSSPTKLEDFNLSEDEIKNLSDEEKAKLEKTGKKKKNDKNASKNNGKEDNGKSM